MIKFDVCNRFTGKVQFTAEIDCAEDAPASIKLGLAVKWGIKSRANLSGADLSGANLSGADLSRANLSGANLSRANLRAFKADLWMTLAHAHAEIPALVTALREGRVNGSTYAGPCACLVGTIANARHVPVEDAFPDRSSSHPAEQWFLMIREGDKPDDATGGGFASAKALEWTLEYAALMGIKVPA